MWVYCVAIYKTCCIHNLGAIDALTNILGTNQQTI